jgi:hypothetical protein
MAALQHHDRRFTGTPVDKRPMGGDVQVFRKTTIRAAIWTSTRSPTRSRMAVPGLQYPGARDQSPCELLEKSSSPSRKPRASAYQSEQILENNRAQDLPKGEIGSIALPRSWPRTSGERRAWLQGVRRGVDREACALYRRSTSAFLQVVPSTPRPTTTSPLAAPAEPDEERKSASVH